MIEGEDIVEIYKGKLLSNCRSRRFPSHPDGYQLFLIGDETRRYDINTKTFPTRRIDSEKLFSGQCYLRRVLKKQNACILKIPSRDSEQFYLLEKLRSRTWRQEQIRRLVTADSSNFTRLDVAAKLLQGSVLGLPPQVSLPIIASDHKRFEFYVRLASDEVLAELQSLLEVDLQLERASQSRLEKSA